ncbi:MAG: universal stress protein, partial [Dongiaceae bacterium]
MWQPILVPLDGSDLAEQALPYAEALAEPGCQLILLEVGQETDDDLSLPERHAGSCARLETAVGDPAEQILRVARDLGVGMIVMTTHGRGAIGRWAFGSVADTVTRMAPVPVLVVRPRPDVQGTVTPVMRRVVVPLDGSSLAEEALPVAEALARRLGVPMHLVTAVAVTGLMPVEIVPTMPLDTTIYTETVAQIDADASAMLGVVSARLQHEGMRVTWEVLRGSAFTAIAEALQEGDIIVMASHGRSGVERWLLGSVAEKLIREGPVPVV